MLQTETFLQQVLMQAVAVLPQWKVRVQKCKAVQMVLNLCSPSVTDKCLIAEAWCPTAKLPELQSALREGGVSGWSRNVITCHMLRFDFLLKLLLCWMMTKQSAHKVACKGQEQHHLSIKCTRLQVT